MVRLLLYMFELIVAILLGRAISRIVQHLFGTVQVYFRSPRSAAQAGNPPRAVQGEVARDPVCKMFVSTELSHRLSQDGKVLHFCSRQCLERYQETMAIDRQSSSPTR
jgi:YHS domain-containing protein